MTPGPDDPKDPQDPDDPQDRRTAYMFSPPSPQGPPAAAGSRDATIPLRNDPTFRAPAAPPESPPIEPPVSGLSAGDASRLVGRLEPGQIIFEKYEVVRLLGQGGMGTVWLVRHRELDIERALKMIVSGIATDAEARARLKREARVMALFSHPNAVAVHDARMTRDAAFIEMEYVRGRCISTMLDPGEPRPLDWTARVLKQLCDVLQVAHDHGIVHRDLKPSNLMLVDGRPPGKELLKVLDFGIAKLLGTDQFDPDDVRTHTGIFIGTAPYSSPDQASKGVVDHRSDLYSVGVILYEFLTGSRPFSGPTTIYDHLHTPPPPFKVRNPDTKVPPEVERVVMRCLSKNPDERPQSAHELAEQFLQALGPDSPTSLPTSPEKDFYAEGTSPTGAPVRTTQKFTLPTPPLLPTEPATGVRPTRPRVWVRHWPIAAVLVLGVAATAYFSGGNSTWMNGRGTDPKTKPGVGPAPVATFPPEAYEEEKGTQYFGKLPRVLVRRKDQTRFILIEGGEFKMGAAESTATGSGDPEDMVLPDEKPPHPVRLSPYYLQETEVTIGEMRAYFREEGLEPSRWPQFLIEAYKILTDQKKIEEKDANRYPASGISHLMAEEFATWAGGRLPTEAEWEFAARSGGLDHKYVWGNTPAASRTIANIDNTENWPSQPGRRYSSDKTKQGIYDMAGNVREWCLDLWGLYADSAEVLINPKGPSVSADEKFVIRGGSSATDMEHARTTFRSKAECELASYTKLDLGFRIVLEAPADHAPEPGP